MAELLPEAAPVPAAEADSAPPIPVPVRIPIVVKVKSVSSAVVTVRMPPVGGSFTGVTLTVIVTELLKTMPSLTWKSNVV